MSYRIAKLAASVVAAQAASYAAFHPRSVADRMDQDNVRDIRAAEERTPGMKYAALIFKNLLRSKRRTVLTVLSIAVSLFIFSALVSIPTVANTILADTASAVRIICHSKSSLAYQLPLSYKQRIAAVPHVEAVTPQLWFQGIYHEASDQFPNFAIDPEVVDTMWPDWGISKQAAADFKRIRIACLVGKSTMHRFNLHVGQQIMLRGTVYTFNLTLDTSARSGEKRRRIL
ncbi:MAG TPA: ABC transporter permease [Candidatus Binataceae bacterium]